MTGSLRQVIQFKGLTNAQIRDLFTPFCEELFGRHGEIPLPQALRAPVLFRGRISGAIRVKLYTGSRILLIEEI